MISGSSPAAVQVGFSNTGNKRLRSHDAPADDSNSQPLKSVILISRAQSEASAKVAMPRIRAGTPSFFCYAPGYAGLCPELSESSFSMSPSQLVEEPIVG
jgi:hypothetical protein